MAQLLYRLGRFSARRAWTVLAGWAVLLGLALAAMLTLGGQLATSFTIPGTETARVSDSLRTAMPNAAGANGSVVFRTTNGSFTEEQKKQVADVLDAVSRLDGVSAVTDPFKAQAQLDGQRAKLADGKVQLEKGRQQAADGQTRLNEGQQQLDAAVEQAKTAGQYEYAKPQLDEKQALLDAERAKLEAGVKQLDEQTKALADGQTMADAAEKIRLVSTGNTTAMASVAFKEDLFNLKPEVKAAVAHEFQNRHIDGVTTDYSTTIARDTPRILGPGEAIGVGIAAIVLLVMMRALLPALTPVVSSLLGVGVGVTGALSFSKVVSMSSITPVLGVMLGLAVGIDYSLFILHRHRRQVLAGMPVEESIGVANGTAGNAVVFAGSTVVIALLALFVARIPFLGVMGAVGAACVAIAVLVAITATPALMGLLGKRVVSRRQRAQIGHEKHAAAEAKPMKMLTAVLGGALVTAALLAVAAPALHMRLGLPDDSASATSSTEYRAHKAVESAFGPGQNGPLVVVAQLPNPVAEADTVATEARLVTSLRKPDVVAVAPIGVSEDRRTIVFQVIPREGPSSESTRRLVNDLRGMSPLDGNVTLGVAGQASGNIDVSAKLADALPLYLGVVIGLSFLIMMVAFRSLLVPLIASLGYALSLFAAFGAMTAVYQWGWLAPVFGVHEPGPILSFAPIIIMGILFGLAMDYQLFLVSGMREAHTHGLSPRASIVAGLRNGQAVVTAAAIIMTAVFGGFMFSEMTMIRPLGFGLAFGVLFDAFAVRMVIVPALMHILGDRVWWLPRWFDRLLPDVDIEGAALEKSHPIA